jgi:CheY-like chemotaxis protein
MINPIILVVEDNPTEQFVLQKLLKNFDYDAVVVTSGEEALDALQLATYEAIIMDVMLPGMGGYECTRRIRELEQRLERRTPIIALTACGEKQDKQDCLRAGMDDYMGKPYDPEELRKMLLRWVYVPANPNLKVLPGSMDTGPLSPGPARVDKLL